MNNKLHVFYHKKVRNKLTAFAILLLTVLLFINNFTVVDVEKTLLVETVGIDYSNNEYIIYTSSVGISTSGEEAGKAVISSASGKSIGDAFENLYTIVGWLPKLNFCNLVILNEKLLTKNLVDDLTYFFSIEQFNDNCELVVTDSDISKILETTNNLDSSGGLTLFKILEESKNKTANIISSNLKETLLSLSYPSKTCLIAYTTLSDNNSLSIDTAIASTTQKNIQLDKTEVNTFNLLFNSEGKYNFYLTNGIGYNFHNINKKIDYDIIDTIIYIKISVDITAKNIGKTNVLKITETEKRELETILKNNIIALYEKVKRSGCDYTQILTNLYKYKYYKFISNNPASFDNLNVSINLRVKSM